MNMNSDQKNTLIAIVLSALVLIGWQIFFGMPQVDKSKQAQPQPTQPGAPPQPTPGTTPTAPGAPGVPGAPGAPQPGTALTREAALALSPRVRIDTPLVSGSIALKGGRIDDLALTKYRETVKPGSPPIVLLAPSGSPNPFYAAFGFTPAAGTTAKLPDDTTLWRQEGAGALAVGRPVSLVWDNGEGLAFRRTITVDDKYLFTIKDEVANTGAAPVTLYPYALISRHGTPKIEGFTYILHEGLIGKFGDERLQEYTYSDIEKEKSRTFNSANAWLGITDKYWAATLLPDTAAKVEGDVLGGRARRAQDLPDRLPARPADDRAGRDRRGRHAAVRRRQGSGDRRRLRPGACGSTASSC